MKKIIFTALFSIGLLTTLNAYEVNGKVDVKWTGYKTEKKIGVSGTFNDIKTNISKADTLDEFLKGSKATISSESLESKNPLRNNNITSTLFSLATSKVIDATIISVDTSAKTLILEVSMNNVKNKVNMSYANKENKIVAKGSIDILDFNLKSSYAAFVKKCAALHANVSYSEVGLEFTIPYK